VKRPALFLAAALTLVAADHPDLSGKWVLNTKESTFNDKTFHPDGATLVVTRQGDGYRSKLSTMDGLDGGTVTEGDWFLDGKEHQIPGTRWFQTSKWDGNVLAADKKSAENSYEEHMRLSISVDGKRVTERVTVKNMNGTHSSTLIWDRM
jgi:hypothetical protein